MQPSASGVRLGGRFRRGAEHDGAVLSSLTTQSGAEVRQVVVMIDDEACSCLSGLVVRAVVEGDPSALPPGMATDFFPGHRPRTDRLALELDE